MLFNHSINRKYVFMYIDHLFLFVYVFVVLFISTTTITNNGLSLFDHIKEYLNYRTNKFIKDIYVEMSSYRGILLQNRQRSSSSKITIGVSPEPYLDLIMNPFNACSWNHLSLGNIFLSKLFFKQNFFRSSLYQIKSKCHSSSMSTRN